MATKSEYNQKFKDPRWQKKRLAIFNRDDFTCQKCFDKESPLVVHHRRYLPNLEPWDYPDDLLVTLCDSCHTDEYEMRRGNEQDLLEMLKLHFYADDIHELAGGFLKMKLQHSHEVVASAIAWGISNDEMQTEIIDKFFESMKNDREHNVVE